jgi:lipopolysaccharide assembly LptE-like protein
VFARGYNRMRVLDGIGSGAARRRAPSSVVPRLEKAPSPDTFSPGEKASSYRSASAFRLLLCAFCLLVSAFCLSCGYHVAGRGDRLPPDIKTVAVPIFTNQSSTFRIEQKLAAAITHEFLERTKFQVTSNPAGADAVLKGTVKEVSRGVITYDLTSGRASSLQISVWADVKLLDLHSNKVVYANPNFVFREEYQVSQTTSGLFEEDQAALDRLSRDVARTLVTDLLENF